MNIPDIGQIFPPAIWGGIIGALVAFLGVNMQLRYNSRERERDRRMQLRRDVYLEAAEGIAGSSEYFLRFTRTDIPLSQLSESTTKSAWLNKVFTVASLQTIAAFSEASAALGASIFDLLRLRLRVEETSDNIKIENQNIEALRASQEQLKSAAAATANEPPTPQVLQRLEWMQQQMEQTWSHLEEATGRLSQLTSEHAKRLRILLEQGVNYSLGYQKKLRPALLALRAELDLPIDAVEFERIMEKIDNEVHPKFVALLDAIESDTPDAPAA